MPAGHPQVPFYRDFQHIGRVKYARIIVSGSIPIVSGVGTPVRGILEREVSRS